MCGSFLVFIALIVGLCIRQGEVHQSETGSRLQEPLLGDHPARTGDYSNMPCLVKRWICNGLYCAR